MLTCQLYDPEEEPASQLKESSVFFNVTMLQQRLWYFMSGTVEQSISLAISNTALLQRILAARKIIFQDSKHSGDTNFSVQSEKWIMQSQHIFHFFLCGCELD